MPALYLLAFFGLFLALPHDNVSAQISQSGLFSTQTFLVAEPEFPSPGEPVTVSFGGNSSQIFGASITWRVNGDLIADTTNQRKLEYLAGDLTEADVITATVRTNTGLTQVYSLTVAPMYIDIVLEPQTRVPDLYRGRALPSVGAQVNATALLHNGRLIDPATHAYTWIVNGEVLEGGPVRGLNQVSFTTPRGSKTTIQLSVFDQSGTLIGKKNIYFLSVRPELVFYRTNALHGISQNALTRTNTITGNNSTIMVEPYYLDIRTFNTPDIIEWEVNSKKLENTNPNPYLITIQPTPEQERFSVSFHVRSTTELLQGVEDKMTLTFDE